ncbi:MAG: GTPase Era [Clostridiales bacterium]|nr:GTPase Era [Clostridiales bacterium]
MKINIINDCTGLEDSKIEAWKPYIDKLATSFEQRAYAADIPLKIMEDAYATLTFVGADEIRKLNQETRNIDKVTDVLSFPILDMKNGKLSYQDSVIDMEFDEDGNKILNLGDIIINPDKAYENADEYGHGIEREISFLTAHSLLHLIGFDHIESKDEKMMIGAQKQMMSDIGLAIDDEKAELTDHLDDNIAYPAGSIAKHCGYISILGRPNVGKSTFINYITGMKVAIVSHKPQTTRTNIRSIYNTDDSQIIFVDTPGVHNPGNKLGKIMVGNSFSSAKNADAVLLIADGRFPQPGGTEKKLLELCKENNKKVVLAVNKSDDVSKESLLPMIAAYSALYDFVDIVPISAKTGDNVEELLRVLESLLPEGPRLFDSEYMTDQSERTISAELIREQILHFINQEIPHGTAVEIDSFEDKYDDDAKDEYDRKSVVIKATIICEKDSHKAIIIGKNGQMIKRIGTSARINIERLVGCKVYLELFVKVREDWKNNDLLLRSYGFRPESEDGL